MSRPRRWLAVLALAAAAGGFLWLRESSLVAVREVTVVGATGRSAADVRSALRRTGARMTTLHVREDELRATVAPYPLVKDLRVDPEPLHRLRIQVIEHDAVGRVRVGAQRVPAAADGTLLRAAQVDEPLPLVSGSPTVRGAEVRDAGTRRALALLGAAPRSLRPLIETVSAPEGGLSARLRSGPQLDFGRPVRLRAKWAAAVEVLADPRAAGAAYVDLRVPGRPVAGTFPDDPVPTAAPGQEVVPTGGAPLATPPVVAQ